MKGVLEEREIGGNRERLRGFGKTYVRATRIKLGNEMRNGTEEEGSSLTMKPPTQPISGDDQKLHLSEMILRGSCNYESSDGMPSVIKVSYVL